MKILHLCVDNRCNAGDILVKEGTRKRLQEIFPRSEITTVDIYRICWNKESVDYVNASFDLLAIGAGGLLFHDSNPNDQSDWQFKISVEMLREIRVPVIVCSVGYNLFRGHRAFTPAFSASMNALVGKAADFSLRHSADRNQLAVYVDPALRECLRFSFCPSLLLRPRSMEEKQKLVRKKTVAVALAGDRLNLRHADLSGFVQQMKKTLVFLNRSGYLVYYVYHLPNDRWFLRYYRDFRTVINLSEAEASRVLDLYDQFEYVISDRGHAQMVPFSQGCKTIVPVSHDKLKNFFADVQMPEYGIEESDPALADKITGIFAHFDQDKWNQQHARAMALISSNAEEARQRIRACPALGNLFRTAQPTAGSKRASRSASASHRAVNSVGTMPAHEF